MASPNLFFARHSLKRAWALLSLNRDFSLLEDGNFVQGDIGGEFVPETVDVDELAVELFLVGVELHEEVLPLLLVLIHTPLQAVKFGCSWVDAEVLSRLLLMTLYLVIDVVDVGFGIYCQQRILLEIP